MDAEKIATGHLWTKIIKRYSLRRVMLQLLLFCTTVMISVLTTKAFLACIADSFLMPTLRLRQTVFQAIKKDDSELLLNCRLCKRLDPVQLLGLAINFVFTLPYLTLLTK